MLKGSGKRYKGNHAEGLAKHFLEEQGLIFVEQNFFCRYGEIDLIFKDEKTLVFVEVRFRENSAFGHAFETVDWHKQQKIIKTARYYLQKKQLLETMPSRLDIIGIEPKNKQNNSNKNGYSIEWIKNAFE